MTYDTLHGIGVVVVVVAAAGASVSGYSREIRAIAAVDDGVRRWDTKFTKLAGNLVPVAETVENDKLECTSHEDSSPAEEQKSNPQHW